MFLEFYLVPFSKYPPNPPSTGNPDTTGLRDDLYTTYQIISVIIALVMRILFFKFRKVNKISYIIPAIYIISIASIYFIWESNPDKIMFDHGIIWDKITHDQFIRLGVLIKDEKYK